MSPTKNARIKAQLIVNQMAGVRAHSAIRPGGILARMRFKFLLALSILASACGKRPTAGRSAVIAKIGDGEVTPVWMGVSGDTLLVALAKHDDQYALLDVDVAKGTTHEIAAGLPAGTFTTSNGKLFMAAFGGGIGEINQETGAFVPVAKLEASPSSIAVAGDRFFIGTHDKVLSVDRSGNATELAGSQLGGSGDDVVVATPAGVFAYSSLAGKVGRVGAEKLDVIAEGQRQVRLLAATKTDVVWTTGEGEEAMRNLIAAPAQGGASKVVVTASAGTHIETIAAGEAVVLYAQMDGPNAGVYAVRPGDRPRLLAATAHARLVTLKGTKAVWIERIGSEWVIRAASV